MVVVCMIGQYLLFPLNYALAPAGTSRAASSEPGPGAPSQPSRLPGVGHASRGPARPVVFTVITARVCAGGHGLP
ncbi:hypothetical protein P8A18_31930 [Streptomyces castrisilvae]|uniref:Uncharacterized protein n=1 Tax=Streptomyces castrisilvae TaxID=3033811 RepID=A0ABY9HUW0_9ACTN|nr:hypothetical protein [Streptomyces sp. Mut1]WLQ37768.1 hypothetical protein P8A18_31930 [Streptomyces sp. Mut1]